MRIFALALSAIALTAAPVRADYDHDDHDADGLLAEVRAKPDRVYGQLGFGFSARELDEAQVNLSSLVFGLAIQRGKYTLIGEAQLGHVRDDDAAEDPMLSGFSAEAGVYLRRDAVTWIVGDRTMVGRLGTWVTAGAAAELMWFDNDSVYRPKVSLGIGLGVELEERARSLGFTLDVRIEAAPAVRWEDDVAGRCTGACEMTFRTADFSALAVVGFPFRP